MFGPRKLTEMVEFPVEGLDLSHYVLNNKEG